MKGWKRPHNWRPSIKNHGKCDANKPTGCDEHKAAYRRFENHMEARKKSGK